MKISLGLPKEDRSEVWRKHFRIRSCLMRNLLSEFFATALLRFIGTGGLISFIVGNSSGLQVNLIWGFAITFSVFTAWKTSGGHVNPAVTVILSVLGKVPALYVPLYCIAQTFGAFFGAALAYGVYHEAIDHFDGGIRSVAGTNTSTGVIFASFPAPYLSNAGAFVDQVAGTGILGLFIAFFCEHRNQISPGKQPFLFGAIASMIGISYSMNMGSPINPACDLGPRIFAALMGYGTEMFTYHDYFFWIPVVAPIVGILLGAFVYILFIGLHLPDPTELPRKS